MAYVIVDTCTKDNECIDACPVDCIHPKPEEANYEEAPQLFVNPEECIDCGACIPVCPTESIYVLEELPADKMAAIARNSGYYGMN
ncbi:MAG: ferredoxin family protein [Bryobacteraceae bacterium]|nr:ferredoxin family protein [Bryobacteraceae bacterium]